MKPVVLAFDQGTTSSRAIVFNEEGRILAKAQREIKQHFPQPGFVEHDPQEIWNSQLLVATEALQKAGYKAEQVACIGITNQRETTVVWDRITGKPIYNAIVWQDKRMAHFCDELKLQGLDRMIKEKTGLVVDAYFSATKLKWLLDVIPHARERAQKGELCFGTIDSWLVWNLTKGKKHVTDVSNASRTMLFNIHTLSWDTELLQLFDIPSSLLPEVCSSSELLGVTEGLIALNNIKIASIIGDQQAALFGQLCIDKGMTKNTYGTGCFMLMNVGEKPIISNNHLITTVAWKIGETVHYALEGSVFIGGAVVQWLRDGLKGITTSEEVEQLARQVSTSDGVYIVPAFAGLGAPYWNQSARGTIVGLTRGSSMAHIARAALESICFQTNDLLNSMKHDAGIAIDSLRVDGGACVNNLLMQFQADVMETQVIKPRVIETTALGAAYLAGLAVGYWENIDAIKNTWVVENCYIPMMDTEVRKSFLHGWRRAVDTTIFWANY
ncbi:MAG: glycerol kinase GlpK [Phycisphaerales bacterium]|nr:glycerol kinase GlpK [Phycisphaerales bacterium]